LFNNRRFSFEVIVLRFSLFVLREGGGAGISKAPPFLFLIYSVSTAFYCIVHFIKKGARKGAAFPGVPEGIPIFPIQK